MERAHRAALFHHTTSSMTVIGAFLDQASGLRRINIFTTIDSRNPDSQFG